VEPFTLSQTFKIKYSALILYIIHEKVADTNQASDFWPILIFIMVVHLKWG